MTSWLVLETLGAAESRADDISEAMGYPHPSTDTQRATLPIEHPTNSNGAVPIYSSVWSWVAEESIDMASLLTPTERAALYDLAEMISAGWFPVNPLPPGE
tara:strand:+ start:356 stop:658 length:303 start_codon:yes stop_codon:yes gene_type:complete